MQHGSALWEYIEAELELLLCVDVVGSYVVERRDDHVCDSPIQPGKGQLDVKRALLVCPLSRVVDFIDLREDLEVLAASIDCVHQACLVILIDSD